LGGYSDSDEVHAKREKPSRDTRSGEQSPPKRLTAPLGKHWLFVGDRYEPSEEKQDLGGQEKNKDEEEDVEIVMIAHPT